eukprot:6369582-Amphidinium_carterae.1
MQHSIRCGERQYPGLPATLGIQIDVRIALNRLMPCPISQATSGDALRAPGIEAAAETMEAGKAASKQTIAHALHIPSVRNTALVRSAIETLIQRQ